MTLPAIRHAERVQRASAAMHAVAVGRAAPGLAKRTSNLFRDRAEGDKHRLDLGGFRHVIAFDPDGRWVDVEGLTTYEDLVDATLAHGAMPAVVPQLKTITVGGAVAGVGIEATSFRHGLVHDTVLELEVLLSDGRVVTCSPDNAHADLFFGFPNSYGTLGYALRVRLALLPVKPFVRAEHRLHCEPAALVADLAAQRGAGIDFLDGVTFGADDHVLVGGTFVDDAPRTSDYTFERIYYRSLHATEPDFLTVRDWLWRWDTDWFWCSKNLHAQAPLVRRLLGRRRLNSRTYQRVMRWNARWGLTRGLARLRGRHPESVIQDVDIPLGHARAFLDFLLGEIGILPVWICPIGPTARCDAFALYPRAAGTVYVNFGFWDTVESRTPHPPGHFNRLVERKAIELGGIKSLYSDSYFERDEFARLYAGERYAALKAKYDPQGRLLGLYEKCVLRA